MLMHNHLGCANTQDIASQSSSLKAMNSSELPSCLHASSEVMIQLVQCKMALTPAVALQVGASVLSRVLGRLQQDGIGRDGVLVGLDEGDDAAVVHPPPAGHVTLHTVDFFRSFISDPYVFGRVAAVHALGVNMSLSQSDLSVCASDRLLVLRSCVLQKGCLRPVIWGPIDRSITTRSARGCTSTTCHCRDSPFPDFHAT